MTERLKWTELKVVKLTEAESGIEVARGWKERELRSYCSMSTALPSCKIKFLIDVVKFLKIPLGLMLLILFPVFHLYNNILYFIPIVLYLFFLLFKLYSDWNCVCMYVIWGLPKHFFFSFEDQLSLYHLLNNAAFPPLIVKPSLY